MRLQIQINRGALSGVSHAIQIPTEARKRHMVKIGDNIHKLLFPDILHDRPYFRHDKEK